MYTVSASSPLGSAVPPPNKRKVTFSLILDIKQKTRIGNNILIQNIFSKIKLEKNTYF